MKRYILKEKGLLAATLLFSVIFAVGSTMISLILKDVIDSAVTGNMGRFTMLIFQTVIYVLGFGLCYFVYSTLSKKFVCRVTRSIRADVFGGIFKKNISDFRSVNSADYLSALTNDVKNIEDNYFVPLLACLQNIIIFLSSFAIMLYLSPLVTLCLFVVTLLVLVVPGLLQKGIQNRQDSFSKKQSRFTVAIKDFLSGFEVIRSYRMNSHAVESFGEKNDTLYKTKYGLDRLVAAVEALSVSLGFMAQCSVLFVSAYLIITGKITAGALVGLVQVSSTIVMPIQAISQNVPRIKGCSPIIERLIGFVDYKDDKFNGTGLPSFESNISVRNLQFGYEQGAGQEQKIIKGIDLSFERGKKYAVVGKSGCGKTTLINLISGYYSEFEGEVIYDDAEIHSLNIEKLNEMSSVIHQNVYMFDDTIMNNICLYKKIEPSALQKALDMSGVSMFLENEKTLEAPVGENGNNLSGGQRQRIAVARALVQGKPILILDEGTSAVDMQTAYDIESQLLKISDLTVITITHSLNSELLRRYDEIIFMEDGTIAESGTLDYLLHSKGAFYDFFNLKK